MVSLVGVKRRSLAMIWGNSMKVVGALSLHLGSLGEVGAAPSTFSAMTTVFAARTTFSVLASDAT